MRLRLGYLLAVLLLGTSCPVVASAEAAPRAPTSAALGVRAKGTLRIAESSDVITFDPARAQVNHAGFLYPVYDTLVSQDADRDVVPRLATAWSRPNPTTWRFTLRDDVMFQDGSVFSAAVVKANLDRSKAVASNPNAPTFALMTSVDVVDPKTIDVHFSTPRPTFLVEMSLVQGMMVSPAAIAGNVDLTRDPRGSGPWRWDPGASQSGVREVYVRKPNYWMPRLQGVERIEMNVIPDNQARFTALRTGQVDIANNIPPSLIDSGKDAGLDVHALDVDARFITILDRDGAQVPALRDPRVRRAIALAIDRKGYVAAILDGHGSSSGGLIAPALREWYDTALSTVPAFNPDRAKKLLVAAGYPDGFSLDIPSIPLVQADVEAIAQMLGAVGIRVDIVPIPFGQLGAEVRKGAFPIAFALGVEYYPQAHLELYASPSGPYNPFRVADRNHIASRLDRAAAEAPAQAKKTYAGIARDVITEGTMIPVAYAPIVALADDDVSGAFIPLGLRTTIPYNLRVAS